MRFLPLFLFGAWTLFALTAWLYKVEPAIWAAAIGASLTFGIAYAGRAQARRQASLDLHREFYSHQFAVDRGKAARFFNRYVGTDWSKTSPYALPDPDNTCEGYSQVLRFWHRVAVLYESGALDRPLTQKLLSRELGYWFGLVFEDMRERKDMYTRELLFNLKRQIEIGEGRTEYYLGLRDGRKNRAVVPKFKWVRADIRWTTRGRDAGKNHRPAKWK